MKHCLIAIILIMLTDKAFAEGIVKDISGRNIRIPVPESGKATCESDPEMLRVIQTNFGRQNISSVITCFHSPAGTGGANEQVFVLLADLRNKEREITPDDMKNQKEIFRAGFSEGLAATYQAALRRARQTTPYYREHYDTLVKRVPSFTELYDSPDGYFVYSDEYPLFGELGPERTVLYITGIMVVKERLLTLISFTTAAELKAYPELTKRFQEWVLSMGNDNNG